ncbi:MAG TPA: CDP-alcohol phosphatidyltransferase family protein [Acidimicrobiales bacterium]|nr:CDP-alcohol phosphatidyltransferase family protein [Acidimicrobiales bacterium]
MATADEASERGWATWPNAVTGVRLLAIPVYLFLVLATDHRAIAAWLLGVLGATDWVDGYLARRLHQVSALGKVLDPTADRILVVAGLVSVAVVGAVPWWFAGLTLAREVIVSAVTLVIAALGARRIDVLWWGKVSTFALMTTYPLFLLCSNPHHAALTGWQRDGRVAGYVLGVLGLALAWVVAAGYVGPARRALIEGRAARASRVV